ncbi:MAG: META domain-containing protein [Aquamicrobium sp.]|uniref:META domain-containing protein n=1 Tax=Aquamicrobium sp. TaxID=1872579 RepID=UPI00349EBC94|nr:META domain-containing protein [Aquamicrobium sp.]
MSRPISTRRHFMLASLGVASMLSALPALADGVEPVLTIKGELTYLQRIALPDNAVAIVEVKPDDAPDGASVTAETRIALEGRQVPVAFTLDVPRAHLDAGKTYVLRGGIEVDSQMRWLSDPVTIDTAGRADDAGTIRLSPYEGPPPFGIDGKEFITGEWRIEEVGGQQVREDIAATIAFAEDGTFSGRLCNSYRGAFKLDGTSISFGKPAATLMACPEPQATHEWALFDAFEKAKSWRPGKDGMLAILDENGRTLVLVGK